MKFNKPKIAIWNAKEQTANLIEVTAPQNYNVVSAIDNKMTKYKDLQIEIKNWNLKIFAIVPVAIGELRSACDILITHLAAISDDAPERIIQKTALLGTSYIQSKFIS